MGLAEKAAGIKGSPLELAYSGGKDSEIMRHIAERHGIPFVAIYKQTTIDRPLTTAYCLERNVQIMRPKKTFLQLVAKKGFPTRRARWCCERFKEYKVHDVALVGVRRAESRARASRYTDVTMCRHYHTGGNVEQFFPLLDWTEKDELQYCLEYGVRLHPHYYREDGTIDISRRLGCIGCPLRGDNGKGDLKEFPKFTRQLLIASYKWWNETNGKSKQKFSSPQKILLHNLYCRSYDEYLKRFENTLFGFSDVDALECLAKGLNLDFNQLRGDFFRYVNKS